MTEPSNAATDQLQQWGWDARLAALFAPHSGSLQPGRVLSEHRGGYVVATGQTEIEAGVSGRYRHEAASAEEFPAVGDWVALEVADNGESGVIQALIPRRTRFLRQGRGDGLTAQVVAANVDTVLLVAGLDHDFNLRRIERYVTLAWSSGADPVIVLNKADLCDDVPGRMADVASVAPGVPVRVLSALARTGLDSLTPLLEAGKTIALIGSSGVGKSTIVNALLGWDRQSTGAVREGDQRGRHTTTMRELVVTPSGALLLDSPGMRSVGMWEAEEGLAEAFADVEAFASQCKFTDCSHGSEPGCAVRAAIDDGTLPASRFESQQKLTRELAALESRRDAAARAVSRRRHRILSQSVRNHMRLKYGPDA